MSGTKTLREHRSDRGVTQTAVAKRLGISRQTYADHEKEPWNMKYPEAVTVCEFLGIEPEQVSDLNLPEDVI